MITVSRFIRIALVPFLMVAAAAVDAGGTHARGIDDRSFPRRSADSVVGDWKANGRDPGFNGRFVLKLSLQQFGDSVHGTYQFEYDAAAVTAPADVFGTIHGGKLELQDRENKLWLSVTIRPTRLDGRLAGGAHNRSNSLPISFERVSGR